MTSNILRGSLAVLAACVVWNGKPSEVGAADKWGTLKGQFLYDGDAPEPVKLVVNKDQEVCGKASPLLDEELVVGENKGLANVVIYLKSKPSAIHPDYAASDKDVMTYDNKNCRFVPRILTMRVSQKLELTNSDTVSHNSNLQPIGDQGTNPLIPPGGKAEFEFHKVQRIPQPVGCNIHGWMKGYILPRDNPYATVSDADGKFEIKDLPAGKLEIQVWHEKSGYLAAKPAWKKGAFEMEIKEGDNDLGEIKVSPKLFEKK